MLSLLISILIGWLLIRWLFARDAIYYEPPPPQIIIHIHSAQIVVQIPEQRHAIDQTR